MNPRIAEIVVEYEELWKKGLTEQMASQLVLNMQVTEFGSTLPTMELAQKNVVDTFMGVKKTQMDWLERTLVAYGEEREREGRDKQGNEIVAEFVREFDGTDNTHEEMRAKVAKFIGWLLSQARQPKGE